MQNGKTPFRRTLMLIGTISTRCDFRHGFISLAGMSCKSLYRLAHSSTLRWPGLAALATLIAVEIIAMYATIIVAFRVF